MAERGARAAVPAWSAGVAAAALVAVVGLAAADGNPVATSPFVRPTVSVTSTAATDEPIGEIRGLGDSGGWLGYVVAAMLLLLLVAAAVTIVVLTIRLLSGRDRGLLRRRVLEPEEVELLVTELPDVDLLGRGAPVVEAVRASLVDVVGGRDLRAAIIAAWLRLEEAAESAGTPRRDIDAPGDLVQRLLAEHAVTPARLEELAELYRRARFSRAELTERDRRLAVHALSTVRADLLGEPAPADAGALGVNRWNPGGGPRWS